MRTATTAASLSSAVFIAARTLPMGARLWLPFAYIALGYWIPVLLVPHGRNDAFEAWLARTDGAVRRVVIAPPRWLGHVLELGYLACFPLLPVAFAVVSIAGSEGDVARFWLAVLAAGYVCYGTLPWVVTRPPRLLERDVPQVEPTPFSRANVFVLERVSHLFNTFPSGHVAVSVAAAVCAGDVSPAAGVALGVVAAAVAIGAVAGRYHYTADVVLGAALGIASGAASVQ